MTNAKDVVKYQQSPFLVGISFENTLFMATPLIGEEIKKSRIHMDNR